MAKTKKDPNFRFAAFDIETTSLDATYGRVLCACFKFSDEDKVHTFRANRYQDEPRLLEQIHKMYESVDVVTTWNGKRFDIPFVNARLMIRRDEHKIAPAILKPGIKHLDLMYQCAKLRTRGNRMDGAAKDLKLIAQKHDVAGEFWVRAAGGDKAALDEIVKHCEIDVRITEELMGEYRPYIINITR